METNFFELLSDLKIDSDWNIVIKKLDENRLLVAVLLNNKNTGDNASKIVQPMILKGTSKELDEGFFTTISTPAKQTDQLFTNMQEHTKSVEDAKIQSSMEQGKKSKETTEKEKQKRRFDDLMKKVEELEKQEKYGQAIGQLPKPEQFPDYAAQIKTRMEELRQKHDGLSLFK